MRKVLLLRTIQIVITFVILGIGISFFISYLITDKNVFHLLAIIFLGVALVIGNVLNFILQAKKATTISKAKRYSDGAIKLFSCVDEVAVFIESQKYEILEELKFSEEEAVDGYYGKIISVRGSKVKVRGYTFADAEKSKAFCKRYINKYNAAKTYGSCEAIKVAAWESTKLLWYDERSLIILEAIKKYDHEALNELFYKMQMVFSRNMITG